MCALTRNTKFFKNKSPDMPYHWWYVADEPLHRGGSQEATTSETPSMVADLPQAPPFPPPLISEPSLGSLHEAMSTRRLPVPIHQVQFDTWGKPTVAWVPGGHGTSHGQQQMLPSLLSPNAPYGSPLDLSADTNEGR